MKNVSFFRLFLLSLALAFAQKALAQTADGPVGVAVNVKALNITWGSGTKSLSMSLYGLNGNQTVSLSTGATETSQLTARLEPGKTYFLTITSSNLNDLTVQSVPPPGYVMEIERVDRERYTLGHGGSANLRMRVLAPMQEYSGRAGTSTSLMSGRVFWQVALGSLANGSSAGAVSIVDTGTGSGDLTDLFTPASFLYEPTSSEVLVYYNATGAPAPYVPGTIRQIIAPEAGVDVVVTSSTQAELKFYGRQQMIPGVGGALYTFTGSPFAWYIINREGSQPNRISIDCGIRELSNTTDPLAPQVQFKHTVLTRSGTALSNDIWTADEWYDDGSDTLSRDVRTRSGATESVVVSQPGGSTVTSLSRTYASVPWGEEIVSETAGTANAITTTNEFYTTSPQAGNYGHLRSVITTGGSWQAYEYFDYAAGTADVAGAVYRTHAPFQNSSTTVPTNLTTDTGVVTTYDYAPDAFGRRTRPTQVTTTIGGVATSSSLTTYADAWSGFTGHPSLYIVTATNTVASASGANLTTITKYFREDAGATTTSPVLTDDFFRGQPHSIQQPDGRKQSFVYQRGFWNGTTFTLYGNNGTDYGGCSRISVINGSSTTPGTLYTTYNGYDIDDLYLVDGKSTMQVTIRDASALVCRTETYAWSSGTWNLVSHVDFGYNLSNLLTDRIDFNGGQYQASYSGEHKDWEKDDSGIRVDYTYDAAGRVSTATKYSGPTTTFAYDAAHHSLSETVSAAGTGETIYSARTYDDAGRLSSELPVGMSTITYAYNPTARTRTATFPDGGTRTETYYADGQVDHVDGSAVVPQYSTFSIESDGRRTAQTYSGYPGSPRSQKATTDWLGRPTHAERPGFTGQPINAEDYSYESGTGRLLTVSRTGYAPTRNDYDNLGTVIRSGLDIGNDGLVLSSSDRISENNQYFENSGGAWWLHQEAKTYPFSSATAVTTSISRKRLTGFIAGRLDETQVTDAEGNTVTRTVDVDRTSATTTITTTRPSVTNPQIETVSNGLTTSVQGHDGLTSFTQYDPLGRAWKLTDTRGNTSTITYKYGSSLMQSISDATGSSSGTVSYDGMGRKQWVQDAAGQYTHFLYNQRGQLTNQWGGGSYPISYGYDSTYGDQTSLSTYRDAPSGESPTFPSGTADITTWTYDTPSGLLWKKTDAGNQVTEFNYNSRGQTAWRKWSRKLTTAGLTSTPVETDYNYDGNTGELLTQTYNDSLEAIPTPSVTYTYTRLGQVSTVLEGAGGAGSRTFSYNASAPWRLDNETLDASFYSSRTISRLYDAGSAIGGAWGSNTAAFFKGRYCGYELGVNGNQARDQHADYVTSDLARFVGVNTRTTTGPANLYVYNYNASSSLVTGYATVSFSMTRNYEAQRNVLSSIYAQWNSGTPFTRYDYTVNSLGQRTTAKQSGSAFADYVQGLGYSATYNVYNYNARGELETAKRYRGDTATTSPAAADELPGGRFEYRYDSIGNRVTSGSTGTMSDDEYVSNQLNQYTQKKNKTVRANGTADAAATVAVAGAVNVGKNDRTWGAEIVPANSAGPVKAVAAVYAAKSGAGAGPDVVRTDTSRSYFIPQLAQTIGYDLDGNMTSDGVWTYTYDAENRLVRMASLLPSGFTGMRLRLDFKYDYQGRRVEKRVYDNDTSTETLARRYLYDGFNVIAETDTSNDLQRTFTWGLDLAGSLTASGGVGALLQINDIAAGKVLFASYDGNGNVASLVNASTGALEAAYEYDPSGNLLRCEGAYAKNNPFRFSTKWQDDETGLINYGVRYYSSCLGRFINRDPIGEKGGLNLYGFCGNDGIGRTDYLGYSFFSKLGNLLNPFSGSNPLNPFSNKNLKLAAMLPHYGNPLYWLAPNFYRKTAPAVEGIVVGAVVGYFAGPTVGGAAAGFISGFDGVLLNGGSLSQAMTAGAIGAAIGAAVGYASGQLQSTSGSTSSGWPSSASVNSSAGRLASNGGALDVLQSIQLDTFTVTGSRAATSTISKVIQSAAGGAAGAIYGWNASTRSYSTSAPPLDLPTFSVNRQFNPIDRSLWRVGWNAALGGAIGFQNRLFFGMTSTAGWDPSDVRVGQQIGNATFAVEGTLATFGSFGTPVFWSGSSNMGAAAAAGYPLNTTIAGMVTENVGSLLGVNSQLGIRILWAPASFGYAVTNGLTRPYVYYVGTGNGWIWNSIEKPVLTFLGTPIIYR